MKAKWTNSAFAYAFGMLAMMIPGQAFLSFHSYYFVDKLGLAVAFATIARSIYLVWDAVNDPLVGYLSDGTRSRYGRRRPWMLAALPVYMLSFIFMFSAPGGMSDNQLFVWFLLALIIFESASAVLWVNYGALFPELFKGDRVRARASAVKQGFQIVAILIGTAATPLIYDAYGFQAMAILYGVLFAVFMMFCISSVREDEEAQKEPPLPFKEAFRETLKNKPFWIFNIANSFAQTVNGLLSSAIPFYAKYALKIPEAQVSILLASIFVSVIPLVAVWYWIVNKTGVKRSWRISLAVYGLSVIPLWFAEGLAGGVAAGIMVGFGLSGFLVTPPVLSSQIIDRDYEKTGRRREGIYSSVGGFITRSSGLLSAVAFWTASYFFGYISGNEPGGNPEAAFRYLICIVPLVLMAVSFSISLLLKGYDGNGSAPAANGSSVQQA
ncbi:MFS transporter [Paenibacillus thermotolerans]|uniref:MFS transporter n=1 Tax=Paenibacillus thermotolerans TaxID=3027807 RepID=UPI0023682F52|nr:MULTISPECIES: MFS transporter [unclassified Paenibacillus]